MSYLGRTLSKLVSSLSPFLEFFYGLTPFAAILFFKFILQQIKISQLIVDNSIDIVKVARKRYDNRRILPRINDSTNSNEFILKLDQRKKYEHQVAGHKNHVLIKHKDMVLKPMNKKTLFLRELKFYESVASSKLHSTHFPYQFLPPYYGVILGENGCGKRIPFLALEDVSRNYKNPCIIDIKMGRETFEPTAPLDKKMREKIKYRHQELIGFRICGFKVFDGLSHSYHCVGKKFGRSLTPELVEHGLAAFFHNGLGRFRLDILEALVQKLEVLLQWFMKQNKWNFYSSSLLITYDAEVLAPSEWSRVEHTGYSHFLQNCVESIEKTSSANSSSIDGVADKVSGSEHSGQHVPIAPRRPQGQLACSPSVFSQHRDIVDVRIIDHAHTLESSGGNDKSYIYSLTSLIRHLELIIQRIRTDRSYRNPSILIAQALSESPLNGV